MLVNVNIIFQCYMLSGYVCYNWTVVIMTGRAPVVNKNVHIRHKMNFPKVVENVK